MIAWLARDLDGRLYLFRDEPRVIRIDLDTSDGHWTNKCTYEWDKSIGYIELHANTYKKVLKGGKRKIECKIKLV